MSSEKTETPLLPTSADASAPGPAPSTRTLSTPRRILLAVLAFFIAQSAFQHLLRPVVDRVSDSTPCHAAALSAAQCPAQPSARNVGADWNPHTDPSYPSLAGARLSSAVQHRTESFDTYIQLKPDDPALDKHYAFADWFQKEYSAVFDKVQHEVVNFHGHLLTWPGSRKELRPILLMAHTDTVPVIDDTLDQWTYPPFSGTIAKDTDGVEYVWGRGASDCKNSLLGILNALEKLVQEGFEPERTILVASGFDEEIGGTKGAEAIAHVLEERYGHDSIAFVFDEGFDGLSNEYGALVASFGMAEKGATNLQIKVETPGGHSSVPPPHTGIGVMSLLLAELESRPFKPSLDPASPYLQWLTCMADYAPSFPKHLARKVKHPRYWPRLARELSESSRRTNSFLATTQAIDVIQGGVKVNALPEVVQATVNHRIAFSSSINETLSYDLARIAPLAKKLGFSLSAFGQETGNKTASHITLSSMGGLEPAPISPSRSKPFELMAGTVKHVFGEETVVAPSGMYANTDTRTMWNLTKHIYRFTPALVAQNLNVHTVDERISLQGHLNTTRFFYKLLRNSEGWDA